LVAEVDERRSVQPKGHGSSSLAPPVPRVAAQGVKARRKPGRGGEEPRAREQRHRWRAPRDPTRSTRKRGSRPGEGALGDGRRPGPAKPPSLTRRRWSAGLAIRSDGDAASRPHPRRVATEDVRGNVASPARGRKHRDREVQRGGADDRGPARTALRRSRGRTGQSLRNALSGAPSGDHVMMAALAEAGGSPSSEAPLGRLIPARRMAGSRASPPARLRPRMSQRSPLLRRKTREGCHETPRGGAWQRGATRNRTVRGVLVKGVGCRSR